jgi:hypothetical protein
VVGVQAKKWRLKELIREIKSQRMFDFFSERKGLESFLEKIPNKKLWCFDIEIRLCLEEFKRQFCINVLNQIHEYETIMKATELEQGAYFLDVIK